MIRKLGECDRIQTLDYLNQESSFNIFIIGDIESFGMETDFQRIYGEFDSKNELMSVCLRYREYSVYYAHETRFNTDYLSVFKTDPFQFISGKKDLVDLIYPYLQDYNKLDKGSQE